MVTRDAIRRSRTACAALRVGFQGPSTDVRRGCVTVRDRSQRPIQLFLNQIMAIIH